ncbi:hypothetical protein KJ359_012605 [Pestalotiopsis sp. 9143b]|nr:hypothetical protein KJ359_012605 [Pestalotiopsis sp. 9143b]
MPGLFDSAPRLPRPDDEGVFRDDSPVKSDPIQQQASPTPIIRVIAATPEGDEDDPDRLGARLAAAALHIDHDTPDAENAQQAWTDELVKKPVKKGYFPFRKSYFIEDTESDDADSDQDTSSSSDSSSGSEHEWPADSYYTRPPPRTPSPANMIRPGDSSCRCNDAGKEQTGGDVSALSSAGCRHANHSDWRPNGSAVDTDGNPKTVVRTPEGPSQRHCSIDET